MSRTRKGLHLVAMDHLQEKEKKKKKTSLTGRKQKRMVKGPEPAEQRRTTKPRKFIAATSAHRNTHKSTFYFISLYSQLTQMAPRSLILL